MQHKIGVYTLGCKVSQYESEAILEEALRRGFSAASCDKECDVCIVNTCTVTAESDRKCRQLIPTAREPCAECQNFNLRLLCANRAGTIIRN